MCQVSLIPPPVFTYATRVLSGPGRAKQSKLGAWVGNQRSRAASLTPERVEQLSEVGTR